MFKEIILQPTSDLVLLLDILKAITLMIFIPGLGVLLASGWTGFVLMCAGRSTASEKLLEQGARILEKLQLGGGRSYVFTAIPLLSLAIIYAQTLYGTQSAIGAAVLISCGLAVMSTYFWNQYLGNVAEERFLKKVMPSVTGGEALHEGREKLHMAKQVQGLQGTVGLVGLSLAAMFGFAAMDLIFHPAKWENFTIVSLMLSVSFWMEFFWFYCLGFALCGIAIMHEFRDSDVCMARVGLQIAGFSAAALPLIGVLGAFWLPADVFTPLLSGLSVLGLLFLLPALASIFSAMSRGTFVPVSLILVCMLATSSADAIKLTLAFRNATQHHLSQIVKEADPSGH